MGVNRLAFVWGLAEATIFFIVPDVWLSIHARKKLSIGLLACVYSLLGALLGGLFMYYWGVYNLEQAKVIVESVPAINTDMLVRVSDELNTQGIISILLGPLSGTPYKVYAIQAAESGIGVLSFVLISIPARLFRFLIVVLVSHYAIKVIQKYNKNINTLLLLFIAWVLFYVFYFTVMPN